MKILEKIVKGNGTIHTQLERSKKCAIYKTGRGDFEVFRIKVDKEGQIFGKEYPEREVYPSNEDFGKTAWYYNNEKRAFDKYNYLVQNYG